MPMIFTGGGSLFERQGHLIGLINSINTFRGSTIPPKIATISADYTGVDQNITEGIFAQQSSWQGVSSSFLNYIKSVASNTIIQMVADDQAQPNGTFLNAINYTIAGMISASQTVKACVVSVASASGGSNVGNPVIVTSIRRRDGKFEENAFAEVISGKCTVDSQGTGGAKAGFETIQFIGQQAASDPLSHLYPLGSGSTTTLTAVSPINGNVGGLANWIKNGNFETFAVANTPDGWHIDTGFPGTTVLKSTAQNYDGAASLQFVGNGSELTTVHQQFTTYGQPGDVTAVVQPLDQLAVCLWIKVDTTPAAGVLRIALVDQNGTVFNDQASVANSFTKSLPTVSSTWIPISGVFRTPAVLPTKVSLQISLTTALSTGSNLFIDHLSLCRMSQFYAGGPYISMFSGNTNIIKNDSYTVTPANDYAGGFQRAFDRLFGMKGLGLILPSATGGAETISGSLIA